MGGYGSMTYAGIKSLIYSGVARTTRDSRRPWSGWGRTTPWTPTPACQRSLASGLYYYYHTLAKAMNALGWTSSTT